MILKLTRLYLKPNYIIGKLYVDGHFFCDTLERPDLNNQDEISCIPKGEYRVGWYDSPHFGRLLPQILNVPNREYILIHPANFVNELKGCVAVGKNDIVGGLSNSRFYSDALNTLLEKETNDIVIIVE